MCEFAACWRTFRATAASPSGKGRFGRVRACSHTKRPAVAAATQRVAASSQSAQDGAARFFIEKPSDDRLAPYLMHSITIKLHGSFQSAYCVVLLKFLVIRLLLGFLLFCIRPKTNSADLPMMYPHGKVVANHTQFSGVCCIAVVERKKWSMPSVVLSVVASRCIGRALQKP